MPRAGSGKPHRESHNKKRRQRCLRFFITANNERKRYAGGLSSHPLIGRPERIVDELVRLQAAGIDGVTLSFVNFKDELPFFIERVLPLLRQAGLRR